MHLPGFDITHPLKLVEYERAATEHVVAPGGCFIVRGNNYKTIKGDWNPQRLIIVEFPDIEAIERYYHSNINKDLSQTRLAGSGAVKSRASDQGIVCGLQLISNPIRKNYRSQLRRGLS